MLMHGKGPLGGGTLAVSTRNFCNPIKLIAWGYPFDGSPSKQTPLQKSFVRSTVQSVSTVHESS